MHYIKIITLFYFIIIFNFIFCETSLTNKNIKNNVLEKILNTELVNHNDKISKERLNIKNLAYQNKNILINSEKSKKKAEYNIKINLIIQQAKSYLGTPYLYGGTTRKGIDCSAFIKNSYSILNINLKRVSSDQSLQGESIPLDNVIRGDLLFFSESDDLPISHVGMIESIKQNGDILFIHSTTSKGVVISSFNNEYWSQRYKKSVRIINFED